MYFLYKRQIYFSILLFIFIGLILLSDHPIPIPSKNGQNSEYHINISDVINLNQVPTHPNLTYLLYPRFDNRYFGSNIFNLTIHKIQGPALDIIVPIGQILNASKKELQNMTIAKQEIINLSVGADTKSVLLTVYCITVRGAVPQHNDTYTISSKIATGDLLLVLSYINNNSLFDFHYTQLAVWAASDGPDQIPSGYIYNNTEVAWANALLAAASTSLVIPEIPVIPGFNYWLLMIGICSGIIFKFRLNRRRIHG